MGDGRGGIVRSGGRRRSVGVVRGIWLGGCGTLLLLLSFGSSSALVAADVYGGYVGLGVGRRDVAAIVGHDSGVAWVAGGLHSCVEIYYAGFRDHLLCLKKREFAEGERMRT